MPQLVTELYDLNMLYEQVGKDDDLLKKFIEIFLSTVPVEMEQLKEAIEKSDLERAKASAHKMKSSYMLMGADWATDLCFAVECIVRDGEKTEKLPEIFKELSEKLSNTIVLLKN